MGAAGRLELSPFLGPAAPIGPISPVGPVQTDI